MSTLKILLLAFMALSLSFLTAQNVSIIDETQQVVQINDSTYAVYNFATYAVQIGETDTTITSLIPEKTVVFDSSGIVDYIYNFAYNEQNTQAAIAARAFDIIRYNRNVLDANTAIEDITNGESNYYEETAKRLSGNLSGTYRIRYDSAGVTQNDLFEVELISNANHPEGRLLRLTNQRNGETFTVQAWHRWKLRIVNWPYGEDVFVWDRTSAVSAPWYRPQFSFSDRTDILTVIRKIK